MAKHFQFRLWLISFFTTISHLTAFTLADESDNYIIHMDLQSMPKAYSSQHSWYSSALSSALDNSTTTTSTTKLIYSYQSVINGFSASLTPSELEALKASPGYVSSIRDVPVKADTTHSSEFIGLNANFGAWPVSNYGKDVIIGLVDTGIWPESESFKDNGMSEIPSRWKGECENGVQFNSSLCNKKLIGARFFNKGLIAKKRNVTISMNSTRDTDGHGTHTSSIAAGGYVEGASFFGQASGMARGMAPMARVAMYKALWNEGAFASDILAAIDMAISDGVDVISLSLGLDEIPLYEDPIAIATFSALDKGIFVTTSAGNEGPYFKTLHNGTPWVTTVVAGIMDREFDGVITLDNTVSFSGLSLYPGNFSSSPIHILFMGLCNNVTELAHVRNKIIVCEDNNHPLEDQVQNLDIANVTGGVFITNNNDLEYFFPSSFPAIFLTQKNGEAVKNHIKGNPVAKARLVFGETYLGTKPAPKVTSYSSRGPSQSCPFVLKPDIMAPGSLVLAAWARSAPAVYLKGQPLFGDFNLLSGTSMSCPHVAGVAALLKAAHPDWSPAAIRSAIMTTSDILDNTHEPIKEIRLIDNKPTTPLALGAGHINPNNALDPGLVYDIVSQDYVNLLCGLNFTQKNISIITKSFSNNCSNPSLDLNYPSFIALFNANNSASMKEFRRTVTHVGEGQSTYVASLKPIKGFRISVIPDRLVLRRKTKS